MYETSFMMLYKGMKESHNVYLMKKLCYKIISKIM